MKVNLRLKQGSGDMPLSRLKLSDLEAFVEDGAVRAINEDFDGIHKNITNVNLKKGIDPSKLRNNRRNNIVIATNETPISHKLGVVPYDYRVIMKNSSAWYQTKAPDSQNLYLAATAVVTADIIIEG